MKRVKVIMNDGKIVEVKYGYANYLIKMGLAQVYSESKIKEMEYQKKILLEKQER